MSTSALKRSSEKSIPKASAGAPCVETRSPFFFVSWAKSEIAPTAAAVPGSACTSGNRSSEKGGGTPKSLENASLPVMTASVPAYDSLKTLSNALSIVSVRT